MTKVVEDDRARQAKPGRPVLYVLAVSLFLAGIYVATMLGWSGSHTTSEADTSRPQATGSVTSPPSPSGAPVGGTGDPSAGRQESQPAR